MLVSVVLPSLALLAWGRRDRNVHRVLAPYLLVLLTQVGVEAVLAQLLFPNIVVLTGLLYTSYRLRQLRHSRATMNARSPPPPRRRPPRGGRPPPPGGCRLSPPRSPRRLQRHRGDIRTTRRR